MRKLTRSTSNRVIMGVCGGLAEYFNIDAIIIRIIWVMAAIPSFGTMAIVYFICGLVIPEDYNFEGYEGNSSQYNGANNSPVVIGAGLVLVGSLMLLRIIFPHIFNYIYTIKRYWPALLIILGIYIIFNNKKAS